MVPSETFFAAITTTTISVPAKSSSNLTYTSSRTVLNPAATLSSTYAVPPNPFLHLQSNNHFNFSTHHNTLPPERTANLRVRQLPLATSPSPIDRTESNRKTLTVHSRDFTQLRSVIAAASDQGVCTNHKLVAALLPYQTSKTVMSGGNVTDISMEDAPSVSPMASCNANA